MALSDNLTRLATRAKEAETRVAEVRDERRADLEQDVASARKSAQEQADKLRHAAEKSKAGKNAVKTAIRIVVSNPIGMFAGIGLLALAGALVVALGPVSAQGATRFTLDVSDRGDFVAQTNFVQCVGASMQMMLNMIQPGRDGSASRQLQLQKLARAWSGSRSDGRQRQGASVRGWAAGLNILGAGPYRLVGTRTLQQAMRTAAAHRLASNRIWIASIRLPEPQAEAGEQHRRHHGEQRRRGDDAHDGTARDRFGDKLWRGLATCGLCYNGGRSEGRFQQLSRGKPN